MAGPTLKTILNRMNADKQEANFRSAEGFETVTKSIDSSSLKVTSKIDELIEVIRGDEGQKLEDRREKQRYDKQMLKALQDLGKGGGLGGINAQTADGESLLSNLLTGGLGTGLGVAGGAAAGAAAGKKASKVRTKKPTGPGKFVAKGKTGTAAKLQRLLKGQPINTASRAASIGAKTVAGGALAITPTIKDAWDVATAGLDNDIATEIQGADLGGVIGGSIGGAIGIIAGPVGFAIGTTVGNTLGELVGEAIDPDQNKALQEIVSSTEDAIEKSEGRKKFLAEQLALGTLSQDEYRARMDAIDAETKYLQHEVRKADESVKAKKEMLEASKKYNDYKNMMDESELNGIEVTSAQQEKLAELQKTYNAKRAVFDKAVESLENSIDYLDQAEELFYNKNYIGNSEIDRNAIQSATIGQLRAVAADDDLSDADTLYVNTLIRQKQNAAFLGNPRSNGLDVQNAENRMLMTTGGGRGANINAPSTNSTVINNNTTTNKVAPAPTRPPNSYEDMYYAPGA